MSVRLLVMSWLLGFTGVAVGATPSTQDKQDQGFLLTGRIVFPSGKPAANWPLTVFLEHGSIVDRDSKVLRSDANGVYRVVLSTGKWVLMTTLSDDRLDDYCAVTLPLDPPVKGVVQEDLIVCPPISLGSAAK